MTTTDVLIIGAGPSGAVAAKLLRQLDRQVCIVERQHFPRFSIGESLLPHCMQVLEQADMLSDIEGAGFQSKNGAVFLRDEQTSSFDFRQKFSPGPGTTFQVQRARFDQILADNAENAGAEIRWGKSISSLTMQRDWVEVGLEDSSLIKTRFVVDASGFGRVLPRLLMLERSSNFPLRRSAFTHVDDNIPAGTFDREKIQIIVHPDNHAIWYWLIPFQDGRSSVGVVAEPLEFDRRSQDLDQAFRKLLSESPNCSVLLRHALFDTPISSILGFAKNVTSLWGDRFVLLGNAGEFLDPVFSSGVTIAMKSAALAAPLIDKHLSGADVDWQQEYALPLQKGVNTFRHYVAAWYDGQFQKIIFAQNKNKDIERMISSILAGYAWDQENPFVRNAERRIRSLASVCDSIR